MRGLTRFIKVFGGIVLVLVLAYAAFKGVMYWRVKQALDQMVADVNQRAQVSYGSIGTDLRGAATVSNIQIRPRGEGPDVSIDFVRVSSDNPLSILLGAGWGPGKTPPSSLRVRVLGLHLPLDQQTLASWREVYQRRHPGASSRPDQGCDSGGFNLDPAMLRRMGFEALTMDMDLGYHLDEASKRMTVDVAYDLNQVQSAQLQLQLAGVVPQDLQATGIPSVKFAGADLHLTVPRKFGDHYMDRCAERRQQTVAQFRKELLAQLDKNLATDGVTLGPGLQQAMSEFYTDWGSMRLRIRPAEPLSLLRLATLPQRRLLDVLGASLILNGNPITDLSFAFDASRLVRKQPARSAAGDSGSTQDSGKSSPAAPQRYEIERSFVVVPVSSIKQQIGKVVRIKTSTEPVRQGVLTAVVNGDAVVQQTLYGGHFSAYVSLDQITWLKVEQVKYLPQ